MRQAQKRIARAADYAVESLEARQLLTGTLTQVATDLETRLNILDNAMQGISSVVNVLPVIGKSARDIDAIAKTFHDFAHPLPQALKDLDNVGNVAANTIKNVIVDTMGNSLGLLGVRYVNGAPSHSGPANASDVTVTDPTQPNFTIEFDLRRTVHIDIPASQLSLGLGSLPLSFRAGGAGAFDVSLTYEHFKFGYQNGGFYFDTSAFRELQFKLDGYLPQDMEVVLGMFYAKAHDNHPGSDFTATLAADVFPTGVGSPILNGSTTLRLGIEASAPSGDLDWLPKVSTDLVLDWNFNTDPTGSHASFGTPTLAFNNVSVGLGGLFGSVIEPLAHDIDLIMRPIQSALDALYSPIPGISDLSHKFGGPNVTIVELSAFNGLFPEGHKPLGDSFQNLVAFATKLRQLTDTVHSLAQAGSSAKINLGDFPILGPVGGSLLVDAAQQVLGNALGGAGAFSQLLAGGTNLSIDEVYNRIRDIPGVGGPMADALKKFVDTTVNGDGVTATYPIVEDTKNQIINALLGIGDAEFVNLTVRYQSPLINKDIPVPLIGPLGLVIHADLTPDTLIRMGYDSRGLRRAITSIVNGGNVVGALSQYLDDGFYIYGDSRLKINAQLHLGAGVTGTGFGADAFGGLDAMPGLNVTMDVPPGTQKVRPFGSTADGDTLIGSNLFRVNGRLSANAGVTWTIGESPLSYSDTVYFAEKELFSFSTFPGGVIPNPFSPPPPPVLAVPVGTFVADLELQMGSPERRANRGIATGDTNEQFTVREVGSQVEVSAYGLTQRFSRTGLQSIRAWGDSGDDTLFIDPSVTLPVYFDGGDGNDTFNYGGNGAVTVVGGAGDDNIDIDFQKPNGYAAFGGTVSIDGQAGNDNIRLRPPVSVPAPITINVYGGADNDNIQIDTLPPTDMNINVYGGSGNDTLSAQVPQGNTAVVWNTPGGVSFDGGGDPGDSFLWRTVTPWVPGAGGALVQQPTDDLLAVYNDRIFRASPFPVTVYATNVWRYTIEQGGGNDQTLIQCNNKNIDISGGDGNDYFSSGGSGNAFHVFGGNGNDTFNHWAGTAFSSANSQQMYGDAGFDTLEFDVHNASSSTWGISTSTMSLSVNNGPVTFLGAGGWEGVKFTGTNGPDSVQIQGGVNYNLSVNLLGGDDSVALLGVSNPVAQFVYNNISLDLGSGAGDSVYWLAQNLQKNYSIDADSLYADAGLNLGDDLSKVLRVGQFAGVDHMTFDGTDHKDIFTIDAAGSQRTYDIHTAGGDDAVTFKNFGDQAGQSTFDGGSGGDSILFDDSARTTGMSYYVSSASVASQYSSGISGVFHSLAGIEWQVLTTGSGNDDVTLSNITNGGVVWLGTGAGDDVVRNGSFFTFENDVPVIRGDLQRAITSISSFLWDGGDGHDVFELDNTGNTGAWTYKLTPASLYASRTGYFVTLPITGAEGYRLSGGAGNDSVSVPSTNPGDEYTLNAGSGNDSYYVGDAATHSEDAIHSPVLINDHAGTDNLTLDDSADITGNQLHISEGIIGKNSDNYFGAGGSVQHSGIDKLGITMTSGADTVWAAPSANYSVYLDGGNPSQGAGGSGDQLYRNTAGATGESVQSAGDFYVINYTNRKSFAFVGFETQSADSSAPTITSYQFDPGGTQHFDVFFSEAVIFQPNPYTLYDAITNTAIDPSLSAASGLLGGGLSIVFPGFPNGRLPDGRYRVVFQSDQILDYAGNALSQPATPIEFSFLSGDATQDARVDTSDFNILAGNFGQSGALFVQGDFDYSHSVDSIDFAILLSQYGKTLPAAGPVPSVGSLTVNPSASPFGNLGVGDTRESISSVVN